MSRIKSGVLYQYEHDGELKIGVVETFFPVKDNQWVALDNGEKFPVSVFEGISTVLDESNREFDASETRIDESTSEMPQIRFDKDGFPILESTSAPSENGLSDIMDQLVNHPDIVMDQPKHYTPNSAPAARTAPVVQSDPVIELVKRANTNPAPMRLDLDIPLYEKDLIGVLIKSFGQESIDKLLEYMIDNIDLSIIKGKIREQLVKHYEITIGEEEHE